MKLLLATDGSLDANATLAASCRLFRGKAAEADLLCVVPELSDGETAVYRDRIRSEADRILAAGMGTLRAGGLDATGRVEAGSPGHTIVRASAGYDVTVLGSHGLRGRTQGGLGPVATQVVSHAAGTVLVGRELPPDGRLRILLCVDESGGSERAVRTMLDAVQTDDAEVDLIHVIEIPWIRLGLSDEWEESEGAGAPGFKSAYEVLRQNAARVIGSAQSLLEDRGVSVSPIVAEGLPETQILSQAEIGQYDLIVLGANDKADPEHPMLGSVSIRVVQGAGSPVLVVR